MRSKYVLFAALAIQSVLADTAHAQSAVQLYGVLDAGITYVNNQGGKSNVFEDTGVMQANRWGLRGSEDLGNGMRTVFTLESGFSVNNGVLGQGGALFGRQAYVGLAGPWGKVTLGRQRDFMYDFLVLDTSAQQVATGYAWHFLDADRVAGEPANNTVKFSSVSVGGFQLGAMFGMSNAAGAFGGTAGASRLRSIGLNYETEGPFAAGLAYTDINGSGGSIAENAFKGTYLRTFGAGARLNLNPLLVFANATHTQISAAPGLTIGSYEIGTTYYFAPDVMAGGGYTYTTRTGGIRYGEYNFGAHYILSKRTDLYVSVNYMHSNNESAPPGMFGIVNLGTFSGFSTTQNQIATRIGLRTLF
ncbi:porin [Paraburkholderia sediminicola]|nr:porin [Paraburkholderia sediminicola]